MKPARLHRGDVVLVMRIAWLLAKWTRVRRKLPLPDLVRAFDAEPEAVGRRPDVERAAVLTRRLLRRAYPRRFCMPRSLILLHLLRKSNIRPDFRVGVASKNEVLVAHAWLEVDGRPFAERRDPRTRFSVVYTYPPRGVPTSDQTANQV